MDVRVWWLVVVSSCVAAAVALIEHEWAQSGFSAAVVAGFLAWRISRRTDDRAA